MAVWTMKMLYYPLQVQLVTVGVYAKLKQEQQ